MDDSRYFKLLWRANAVLVLVVLLGVSGDSVYRTVRRWFWRTPPAWSNATETVLNARGETVVKGKWRYGDPEKVPGGPGFIVPLYSTLHPDDPSRYYMSLRNLLFVNKSLEARRWLMPDNEREITSWKFLEPEGDGATPGILLNMWKKDPDAGEEAKDAGRTRKLSIHLARPDCTGLVRVLEGLTRCIGSEFVDQHHATFFYVKGGAGHASKIALADFSVVGTASLALAE